MTPSDALEAVKPFIDSDVCSMEHQSREQLEAAVAAVLPNAATLKELAQFLEPFLALRVAFTPEAAAALAEERAPKRHCPPWRRLSKRSRFWTKEI